MLLRSAAIGALLRELLGAGEQVAAVGATPDKLHALSASRYHLARLRPGDVHGKVGARYQADHSALIVHYDHRAVAHEPSRAVRPCPVAGPRVTVDGLGLGRYLSESRL